MNVLMVVEKPYVAKHVKAVLAAHPNLMKDHGIQSVEVAYNVPVFNIDMLHFHEKNGHVYDARTPVSDAYWLELDALQVPKGTFFEIRRQQAVDMNAYDLVIGCTDCDVCGILGFQKFVEVHGVPDAKFLMFQDLTESELLKALSLDDMRDFADVFAETADALKSNGFASSSPRKADVAKLRKRLDWTRSRFADFFGIPYRTVENWESFVNDCPEYLFDLMYYKLRKEGIL